MAGHLTPDRQQVINHILTAQEKRTLQVIQGHVGFHVGRELTSKDRGRQVISRCDLWFLKEDVIGLFDFYGLARN